MREGVDGGLARRLDLAIERQHEVVAGLWRRLAERPTGRGPGGVHLHPREAIGAAEDVVVAVLDTGLPDLVARLEPLVAGLLQLVLGDLAYVSVDVRGQRAGGVVADVHALPRTPGVLRLVLPEVIDE